jgi:hypothetical protein
MKRVFTVIIFAAALAVAGWAEARWTLFFEAADGSKRLSGLSNHPLADGG